MKALHFSSASMLYSFLWHEAENTLQFSNVMALVPMQNDRQTNVHEKHLFLTTQTTKKSTIPITSMTTPQTFTLSTILLASQNILTSIRLLHHSIENTSIN